MGTDSFLSPRGLKTLIKHNKLILVQPWVVCPKQCVWYQNVIE